MRGAPHRGLASAIRRMSARSSEATAGRPGPRCPLPGPQELEAGPLPPDHGGGLDDGDGIRPAAPHTGQQDPQQSVGRPHAWARRGALEDGQLVP
jgi:hypothetical protein